jgi:GGDEF domain-containing protein
MTDPHQRRGGEDGGHERRGGAPGDDMLRLLVIARDPAERTWAVEIAGTLGYDVRTAERVEALAPKDVATADAIVLLPRRAAVPPDVALCRVRTLAPGRAVVLALPESSAAPDCLAGLGPGCAVMPWPAGRSDLARALERAVRAAGTGRALAALAVPETARAGLQAAMVLGGADGQAEWFLQALVQACSPLIAGGAVLVPAANGFRVVALRDIRESYVLRLVRRHPPPYGLAPGVVRPVRIGRTLRSVAAQLRALRAWWWMSGPACAGPEARTLLFQERSTAESAWLDGAFEVVARGLGADGSPAVVDLETGLEAAGARSLAERALAVAGTQGAAGTGRGAVVVLVSLPHLRDVRREHGPRVEARLVAAAVGRIRRGHRPGDRLVRVGPEQFALVLPADRGADAERLADRVLGRLHGGVLLRRRGEGVGGDEPFELEVRATFVDAGEETGELAERLARMGVPRTV